MYKNITVFHYPPSSDLDIEFELGTQLAENKLREPGPLELSTHGAAPAIVRSFITSVGSTHAEKLTYSIPGVEFIGYGRADKILPGSVVNDELARRVQKIAEQEDRKVGGKERRRIKEDVVNELLPRALVRHSRVGAYFDTDKRRFIVGTASRKAAENVVSFIRQILGSFPAVGLVPEESPRAILTSWLTAGYPAEGFQFGDEIVLRDFASAGGAVWRARNADLSGEETQEHLRNGMQVERLGLVFEDRLSFVLGDDLVIRKLKFLDVVMDEISETADGDEEGTVRLFAAETERLLDRLFGIFGVPVPVEG